MKSHTCPKCSITANTDAELAEFFGTRTDRGVVRPQSQCRRCRADKRHNGVPTGMKAIRFGLEIEFHEGNRAAVCAAIATAIGGTASPSFTSERAITLPDGRKWTVVADGSVPRGGEVVSPILTYADLDMVQAVARAIASTGAKSSAAGGAGIHVHIDAAALSNAQIRNLVRLAWRHEGDLRNAANIDAGRSRYCREIPTGFVNRLDEMVASNVTRNALMGAYYAEHGATINGAAGYRYHHSRYVGVNLHATNKGTVEFRWFNGTLHAGKIKSYIQLCLALGAKAIDAKQINRARKSAPGTRYNGADGVNKAARALFAYLGTTGEEFRTMRFHLTNGMRESAGLAPKAWRGAAAA